MNLKFLIPAFAGILAAAPVPAAEFPWDPAQPGSPPPINSTQPKAPQYKTPPVTAPKTWVPGHQSTYGFVPGHESAGPPPAPVAPGEKTQGWVPGHHDENGAWVPGHPE